LTHEGAAVSVTCTLEPPTHSACLSAGQAVSQLAHAPLAGAEQCAGPTTVFSSTTSEEVVVHPQRAMAAKAESTSVLIRSPFRLDWACIMRQPAQGVVARQRRNAMQASARAALRMLRYSSHISNGRLGSLLAPHSYM